ncbi:MAG: PAS domain-containing sensor histidine kinase [Candidatus Kapaibacterium sp.]|nr:MAG: PAS domain-containing sensor histidine kinase [Candidatus Kapabacteria bacterium]
MDDTYSSASQKQSFSLPEHEFLQSLFDGMQEMVFALDRDYRLVMWNKQYEERTSLIWDVPIKRGLAVLDFDKIEAATLIQPNYSERLEQHFAAAFEGQYVQETLNFMGLHGNKHTFSFQFFPIHEQNGEVQNIGVSILDITHERAQEQAVQEFEQHLEQLVGVMSEGLVMTDETFHITFLNPVAERIFGYKISEIVGQSLHVLVPMKLREQHKNLTTTFAASNVMQHKMSESRLVMALRKDGSQVPIEVNISRSVLNGKTAFFATIYDVSERFLHEITILELNRDLERRVNERTEELIQTNLELAYKNELLERINTEKTEIIGIVAHDLKNPISVIQGLAEVMLSEVSESESPGSNDLRVTIANLISDTTDNMLALIRNLLDNFKLEMGGMVFDIMPLDIILITQRVLKQFQQQAEKKKMTLAFEPEAPFLLTIISAGKPTRFSRGMKAPRLQPEQSRSALL